MANRKPGRAGGGRRLHATNGRSLRLQRISRPRFTQAKQDRFFETLATTCNVEAAVRAAKVASSTVYRERARSAAFRARWAAALAEGYARLEAMMLERAMNGTVKTVTRADGSTQTMHEYPNAIALTLLRLHREAASAAEIEHEPEDIEEVRRRLARKIERLRARLVRDGKMDDGAS